MADGGQLEEENAIALLNMYSSRNGKPSPVYKEKEIRGEPHRRTFTMTCEFVGLEVCCEGKSKKEAKRACAMSMVKKMREEGLSNAESVEYEPVAVLQQLLQKKNYPVPKYEEAGEAGLPHRKQFTISVSALYPDGRLICEPVHASGSSKKEAKKKAANELLTRVKPLLDTSPLVKHTTSYTSSSPSDYKSRGTMDQSFTFHDTSLNSSTASMNTSSDDNLLNTSMASLNIQTRSHDATDGRSHNTTHRRSHDATDAPVELPEDIDLVYVDGDDKQLCLATVSHDGEKITGCGRGNNKESAKQNAIENLKSNFSILCTPVII